MSVASVVEDLAQRARDAGYGRVWMLQPAGLQPDETPDLD